MVNTLTRFAGLLTISLICVSVQAQTLPPELSSFQPINDQPVFTGNAGQWDALIRERGWVMKEGHVWRMWYTGYDTDDQPVTMKLGLATSTDGLHWKRHSDQPIFDERWVEDMMIVRHDGRYYMFAEGANDQAQLLTSADGIRWDFTRTLDVRLADGQPIPPGPYGTPSAWYEKGTWYLFYERRDQGIWLATSTDMKVWTNVSDDPLLVPGPDQYDKLMIAMNQIVKIDDSYYAVLHGTGTPTKPRDWCTYFAVSKDLRNWKKCEDGPVLPVKDNKSSGVLVRTDKGYRLFTMHAQVDVHEAAK